MGVMGIFMIGYDEKRVKNVENWGSINQNVTCGAQILSAIIWHGGKPIPGISKKSEDINFFLRWFDLELPIFRLWSIFLSFRYWPWWHWRWSTFPCVCEMLIFVLLISLLIHKRLHCPIGIHLWEVLKLGESTPSKPCPALVPVHVYTSHQNIKLPLYTNCHYTLHVLHCTQPSSSQPRSCNLK